MPIDSADFDVSSDFARAVSGLERKADLPRKLSVDETKELLGLLRDSEVATGEAISVRDIERMFDIELAPEVSAPSETTGVGS